VKVIWKFKLKGADNEFDAPAGARPLCTQIQDGPVVWLECERSAPPSKHRLRAFATGQNIPDDAGDYVGTLQFEDGRLILHIFHKQVGVQLAS
jgi:hypothetical protein